jgi:hypothetical protein
MYTEAVLATTARKYKYECALNSMETKRDFYYVFVWWQAHHRSIDVMSVPAISPPKSLAGVSLLFLMSEREWSRLSILSKECCWNAHTRHWKMVSVAKSLNSSCKSLIQKFRRGYHTRDCGQFFWCLRGLFQQRLQE